MASSSMVANYKLTVRGVTRTYAEWEKIGAGAKPSTMYERHRKGWDPYDVVYTPPGTMRNHPQPVKKKLPAHCAKCKCRAMTGKDYICDMIGTLFEHRKVPPEECEVWKTHPADGPKKKIILNYREDI